MMMAALLEQECFGTRTMIEGVGRLGWTSGFNPYWVYEKYGFKTAGEPRAGWFLMQRRLRG